ncbi:glycoside hydrolase family 31 protein [bacterium]|nr:glycoside hydrolase family 31 protein [bacterium]
MYRVISITDNALVLEGEGRTILFSLLGEKIIRFKVSEEGVDESNEFRVALEKTPSKINVSNISDNEIKVSLGSTTLFINLNPFSFKVYKDGKEKFSTDNTAFIDKRNEETIFRFNLSPEERIYGLGQDHMADLDQRGKERRCWHQWNGFRRSGNDSVPFLLSSENYGLFLDTSWPVRFNIGGDKIPEKNTGNEWAPSPWDWDLPSGEGNPNRLVVLLYGSKVGDFYIILGEDFNEIIRNYYDITGLPRLLPKWAYGFIQCKNRYRSEKELLWLGKKFRERGIPGDVLVIDWLWFKEFGDLEWDRSYWPNPEETFKRLSEMGFKVMQAQHPFIDRKSLKYEIFKEKGYLNDVPPTARPTFDHSNPEARKAWWEEIKPLYETGIRGYWTDMGEIEEHKPGTMSYLGPREKVHNVYTLLWTKGLYENQRETFGTRSFSLARTFWCGIHRYSTAMWSGDINSSWEVLKDQVVIGQDVTLTGMPYWCTDIGGFFFHPDFTSELYIRWFQWGTFCPIFRTHGTRPENEPWSFGKDAEEILKKFITLRYRLMPYIYSLAHRVITGKQIMRAMVVDYPEDKNAYESKYQFMFGDILVSPVVEKNSRIKETYLPEGYWYDFWTGKRYKGKRLLKVPAPIDRIPLFVRNSSIIPMNAQEVMYVDEKPLKEIDINIYTPINGEFEIYEDDGVTYSYEEGKFVKTKISACETKDQLRITITSYGEEFSGFEKDKILNLYIFGLSGKEVKIGDKSVDFENESNLLKIRGINYQFGSILDITVEKMDPPLIEEDNIDIFVDALDKEQDSHIKVNVLIINGSSAPTREVYFEVDKSEVWSVVSSELPNGKPSFTYPSGRLTLKPGDIVQKSLVLSPIGVSIPPYEDMTIRAKIETKGEIIEKTFKINLRDGNIISWKVIGPFDSEVEEIEEDLDKIEYKIGDKTYKWSSGSKFIVEPFGYLDLLKFSRDLLGEGLTKGTAYAKGEIYSDEERQIRCSLYGEGKLEILVNGASIYKSDSFVYEDEVTIPLKKGINKILVKVSFDFPKPYSGREFGFRLKVLEPVRGVYILG